jgi:hypothetical protein
MDDAAHRISRYLSRQLVVNACCGVPIGFGLAIIGIPNAALWGIFAASLRFLPYLGIVIAACFPVALALAVDACSPAMSNGTCASASNRSCLMMMTRWPRSASVPANLTPEGGPVHSFQSLLRDLATCTLNWMTTTLNEAYSFPLVATPTALETRAFALLGVDPVSL